MSTERRSLKMHPRLLWDVIHKQAGSLSKAILEGVMNSVDAGATRCDVTLDAKTFSITDDGKGFADEQEITDFFETFGHPHEEGDAKYGRFRMGRGQMFAFGNNKWATNIFRMEVDLKPQKDEKGKDYALGYDFSRAEHVDGCRINVDLYKKLAPSELDDLIRELKEFVKYVDIPVTLNGAVVSTDPRKEKWDFETDTAWVKKRVNGSLDVYNQGVLVTKMPSYVNGFGGVVVSKVALDVNFARNQVQDTCKVFRKVMKRLQEDTLEAGKKSAPLNDDQRENLARRLASADITLADIPEARIITDVTGSHHKFDQIARLSNFHGKIVIAPRGDRVAEMAHTRKLAFVVTPETAGRFGASTAEELVNIFQRIAIASDLHVGKIAPMERDAFLDVISANHEPVADKELNAAEKLAMKALREGYKHLLWEGRCYDRETGRNVFSVGYRQTDRWGRSYETRNVNSTRRISAGLSDTALGWTNGIDEIWVRRDQLKLVKDGLPGMTQLAALLLHEQLHEGPSTGTHEHGVDFYERFHDIALRSQLLPKVANVMLATVMKELRNEKKRASINFARGEDLLSKAADFGIGQAAEEVIVETEEAAEEMALTARP